MLVKVRWLSKSTFECFHWIFARVRWLSKSIFQRVDWEPSHRCCALSSVTLHTPAARTSYQRTQSHKFPLARAFTEIPTRSHKNFAWGNFCDCVRGISVITEFSSFTWIHTFSFWINIIICTFNMGFLLTQDWCTKSSANDFYSVKLFAKLFASGMVCCWGSIKRVVMCVCVCDLNAKLQAMSECMDQTSVFTSS